MKTKTLYFSSLSFIGLSILSLLWVSLLAWTNPQQVMDLVQVQLGNNDALSSIRGVYGGVGLVLVAVIIYLGRRSRTAALVFLGFFWAMYALSRVITILAEGPLGDFGKQWLVIELVFAATALLLAFLENKTARHHPVAVR